MVLPPTFIYHAFIQNCLSKTSVLPLGIQKFFLKLKSYEPFHHKHFSCCRCIKISVMRLCLGRYMGCNPCSSNSEISRRTLDFYTHSSLCRFYLMISFSVSPSDWAYLINTSIASLWSSLLKRFIPDEKCLTKEFFAWILNLKISKPMLSLLLISSIC